MSVRFFFCGDVVNTKSKENFIDSQLETIIKSCDFAVCNLEAPIQHENMQKIKKAGPYLYQARESIKYLKEKGFNICSLANNHIYDYGQKGLEYTIREIISNGMDFIGAGLNFENAYLPKILEKNNIKIGLLAACENEFGCLYEEKNRGGYAWLLHHRMEDNIRALKTQSDFVVLVAHAGVEDIDIPIKEWRDKYRRFCDIGVDVVVGHHPHVPQGFERYKNSLIFYSLGNFYFDTSFFENKSDDSYSVVLNFEKGNKVGYELIFHKKINGKTTLIEEKEASFDMSYLCKILGSEYEVKNNNISLELFHKYYYGYYESAMGIIPKNAPLLYKIISILRKVFFFIKVKDKERGYLLLLHNIRIDSHRFLVQRALILLSKEDQCL